jgi:hypothetical protein
VLPALSVAVHVTLFVPGVLVSSAPQLALAMPESASVAFGLAVALWPTRTGVGLTTGLSVGAVASRLTVTLWLAVPPC